ncbi:NosD domain-containing protein [Haloarcula sp. H-GB5]
MERHLRGNALLWGSYRRELRGEQSERYYHRGRSNYLARNTAVRNTHGLQVISKYSVYLRNVLTYAEIGARSSSLLPTNNVTENAFVGNARHVSTQAWNVRHVWERNDWSDTPRADWDGDGTLSRAFRPTAPIDSGAVTHPAPRTLSSSLALALLRRAQQLVPGLQTAGVVDPTSLIIPVCQRGLEIGGQNTTRRDSTTTATRGRTRANSVHGRRKT